MSRVYDGLYLKFTQIPMMLGPHNYGIYPNDTDMYGNWTGPLSSRSSTSHTRDSTP